MPPNLAFNAKIVAWLTSHSQAIIIHRAPSFDMLQLSGDLRFQCLLLPILSASASINLSQFCADPKGQFICASF